MGHIDIVEILHYFLQHLDPVVHGKKILLRCILRNRDSEPVEKLGRPFDYVVVAVCGGVKTARVHSRAFHVSPFTKISLSAENDQNIRGAVTCGTRHSVLLLPFLTHWCEKYCENKTRI